MANEEIIFTGQSPTYVNSTTEYLQFYIDSVLTYIPTNLFKYFSNFRGFIAYNTSTTYIVTDAFNFCPMLEVLYIYYSPFTALAAGFAQSCSNIFYIDIQFNLLETIDVNAFLGLVNLKMLYLSNNRITCIPPDLFILTPALEIIEFNSNPIDLVDPRTFDNLLNVTSISLASCQIALLPSLSLYCSGMTNPVAVNLNDNPFVAVDPNFLNFSYVERFFAATSSLTFTLASTTSSACFVGIANFGSAVTNANFGDIGSAFAPCYDNWIALDAGTIQASCYTPASDIINGMCVRSTTETTTTTISTTETITETTTNTETSTITTTSSLNTTLAGKAENIAIFLIKD